jgi:hypothetical protein
MTLVFKKNAKLFAENWEKSQKIVIITSTPALKRPVLKTKLSYLARYLKVKKSITERPSLGKAAFEIRAVTVTKMGEFSSNGWLFTLGSLLKIFRRNPHSWAAL